VALRGELEGRRDVGREPSPPVLARGGDGLVEALLGNGERVLDGRGNECPTVVRIGLALEAVAVAGIAIALPADGWVIAPLLFIYGAGVGLATAQLTIIMLSEVPLAQSGEASGLQSTVRQLGSALRVALLGGLLIASLGSGLADSRPTRRRRRLRSSRWSGWSSSPRGLRSRASSTSPTWPLQRRSPRDAMITAAKQTTALASGVLVLGLLSTLALPHPQREEEGSVVGSTGGTRSRQLPSVAERGSGNDRV
jgi:MFS family permease